MRDDPTAFLDSAPRRADPEAGSMLSSEELGQVLRNASTLLAGIALPEKVDEDHPEFFRLAEAFVHAYGSSRLKHLREQASLFEGWGEDPLTEEDRLFLVRLMNEVKDMGRDRRSNAEPPRRADAPLESTS